MLALSLGLFLMAGTAQAQKVDFRMKDLQVCVGKENSADKRIQACTRLIRAFEGVRFGAGKADEILVTAFYNRARAYIDKGELDLAIQDYGELILMDQKDYKPVLNRGLTYYDFREYDKAIQDYDQVIRMRPDDAETLNSRGLAYNDKGEYDRAIQDYDQTIRMRPNFEKPFNNRGNSYRSKGEYDRAIQDYDQAIRIKPTYAKAFYNRGNVYRDKGEYDRAIQDYDQAIRISPDYVFAFGNRGDTYREKGDFARALQDYDQALRLEPRFLHGYYARGAARFLLGQFAVAAADFAKGANLAPRDLDVAIWLYLAEVRGGQKAEAVLTGMQPSDLKSWPGPLISLYLGKIAPAAVLEATNDPDPKRQRSQLCKAQFHLGEHELIHNHRKEAIERFQTALETCTSDTIEFQAAKEELKQLGQ